MQNYNKIKRAFTLAEIIIALAIIGVICIATMGILKTAMPTKEESIHKKVTTLVEQAVERLADNEVMYPLNEDKALFGFKNTQKVIVDGQEYEGDTKFCKLFATQFTTTSAPNCAKGDDNSDGIEPDKLQKTFSTTDGVDWYLPVTTFSNNYAVIKIDVNGESEGSNCTAGAEGCSKPDQFVYYVRANGTVTSTVPTESAENLTFTLTLTVENPEGGTYQIGKYKNVGEPDYGEAVSGTPHVFQNLEEDSIYVIKANPKPGYSQKWVSSAGAEKNTPKYAIKMNKNRSLTLKFVEVPTYCITLVSKNNGCDKSNLNDCINYPIITDTNTNEEIGKLQTVGKPDIDAETGLAKHDGEGNFLADTSEGTHSFFACGFTDGNYTVNTTAKSGYKFGSDTTTTQPVTVPSGAEKHVTVEVQISVDNPCASKPGTSWNGSECVCTAGGGQVWDDTEGCKCPDSKPNWDGSTCGQCPTDYAWDSNLKECVCQGNWDICTNSCVAKYCPNGYAYVCGTCYKKQWQFVSQYVNYNTCITYYSADYCNSHCETDTCLLPWINAAEACGGQANLPTINEMYNLSNRFYDSSGFNNNLKVAEELGLYPLVINSGTLGVSFFTQDGGNDNIFTFYKNFASDEVYESSTGGNINVMCVSRD